jgi:ribonuclease VapC
MAEVASHYSKLGMPDDVVAAMLTPLPITLVDSDAEQCWRPADCAA